MDGVEELEELEELVLQWLPLADADVLTGLCEEYRIPVTADKVGKKPSLLKLVFRYLNSETVEQSPDGGKAMFLKLHAELAEILGKTVAPKVSKIIPKSEKIEAKPVRKSSSLDNENAGRVTFHRLREFKINGTIGNAGQKDSLSYTSLSFQMKQGKATGYSSEEICAAVIRAIKPGNSLRDYLESKGDVSEASLIEILRSHFEEKDSTHCLS